MAVSVVIGGRTVTVRPNVGGRVVPIKVQTYQFGDLSASASTAAAIAQVGALVTEAETAATAAETAQTGAETAQGASETAQGLSEDARDLSEFYRDSAEDARDQTAVYAALSNMSGLYTSTALGLAGTASGSYFGVPGTTGIAYYLDNAGSAVAGPVMPSIDYLGKHHHVVPVMDMGWSGSGSTANNRIIQPINADVILTGNGYSGTATNPRYLFRLKSAANSVVGSVNYTIKSGDGSSWLPATPLKDTDGNAPGLNGLQANKWVQFARIPAASLEIEASVDAVSVPLSEASLSADLKTPKPLRPVSSIQRGQNLCQIGVRMHEDCYDDLTLAAQSDHLRVGYMNVAPFMSLGDEAPDGLMSLNSLWACVRNQEIEFANFIYTALDSGTTVETGLVWSAFGPVLIAGDMADAADTPNLGTNFQLSGEAHGHVTDVVRTRTGYRKDSSVGTPTAATNGAALTITVGTVTSAQIGDRVRPSGVVGMTQINDVWLTVTGRTVLTSPTRTVLTFAGTDSTSFGPFTSCAEYLEHEVTGLTSELNEEWDGLRVVESVGFWMNTPGGDKWGYYTADTTFASEADYLILHEWQVDCGHADILIDPGTRTGGYPMMCPLTGPNRARGVVAGVAGALQTIDKRDATQTTFAHAEIVRNWVDDFDDIKLVAENIAGPGYTHFEDTGSGPVGVPYAANVFAANNDYGPKEYWPIYPVSTPVSLAGKVLSGGFKIRLERGPAEV